MHPSLSSSQATENNNKLFPYYQKKLSQGDPTLYSTFSGKLASWLSSERAYYPEARPQIVDLLQTAYTTLQRAVEAANSITPFYASSYPQSSMAASYIHLLETVKPFIHHFIEADLRAQLFDLIATMRPPDQVENPSLLEHNTLGGSVANKPQIAPGFQHSSAAVVHLEDGNNTGLGKARKRRRKAVLTELVELDVTSFYQKIEEHVQTQAVLHPVPDSNMLSSNVHTQQPDYANPFSGSYSPERSTIQETSVQISKFGIRPKIIAIQLGLMQSRKICIEFAISETQFHALSAWISKSHDINNEQIDQYLCLSLGRYDHTELVHTQNQHPNLELEQVVGFLCSSWPNDSSLAITIQETSKIHKTSLAPPFVVTEDGFVDVSKFITLGNNKIELLQQLGMAGYIFVLHAHHPTPGQIAAIKRQEHREKQWKEWLNSFQYPLVPLSEFESLH